MSVMVRTLPCGSVSFQKKITAGFCPFAAEKGVMTLGPVGVCLQFDLQPPTTTLVIKSHITFRIDLSLSGFAT